MQDYALQTMVSIDRVKLHFELPAKSELQDSQYEIVQASAGSEISGLYLEGARWDESKNEITENAETEIFNELPLMKVVPSVEPREQASHTYEAPLYKTTVRRGVLSTTGHSTNFISLIPLPSSRSDLRYWVRRGVALVTQPNF